MDKKAHVTVAFEEDNAEDRRHALRAGADYMLRPATGRDMVDRALAQNPGAGWSGANVFARAVKLQIMPTAAHA